MIKNNLVYTKYVQYKALLFDLGIDILVEEVLNNKFKILNCDYEVCAQKIKMAESLCSAH